MDVIRNIVKEVFQSTFPKLSEDSFDFKKSRNEFENWDSLTHMQLISKIEGKFGISFDMDEVADINSPEDLVSLVSKKKNG